MGGCLTGVQGEYAGSSLVGIGWISADGKNAAKDDSESKVGVVIGLAIFSIFLFACGVTIFVFCLGDQPTVKETAIESKTDIESPKKVDENPNTDVVANN